MEDQNIANKEMQTLEGSIETALNKMSKAHDIMGRLEQYVDPKNESCRVRRQLACYESHVCEYMHDRHIHVLNRIVFSNEARSSTHIHYILHCVC